MQTTKLNVIIVLQVGLACGGSLKHVIGEHDGALFVTDENKEHTLYSVFLFS